MYLLFSFSVIPDSSFWPSKQDTNQWLSLTSTPSPREQKPHSTHERRFKHKVVTHHSTISSSPDGAHDILLTGSRDHGGIPEPVLDMSPSEINSPPFGDVEHVDLGGTSPPYRQTIQDSSGSTYGHSGGVIHDGTAPRYINNLHVVETVSPYRDGGGHSSAAVQSYRDVVHKSHGDTGQTYRNAPTDTSIRHGPYLQTTPPPFRTGPLGSDPTGEAWSTHMEPGEWTTYTTTPSPQEHKLHQPSSTQFQSHGHFRNQPVRPVQQVHTHNDGGEDHDNGVPAEPVFDMSPSDNGGLSEDPYGFDDEDLGGDGPTGSRRPSRFRTNKDPEHDDVYLNEISDILDGEFNKMERE